MHTSTVITKGLVNSILQLVNESLIIKEVNRKLPDHILSNLNKELSQTNHYIIDQNVSNKAMQNCKSSINYINDQDSIKVDNRAPNECKLEYDPSYINNKQGNNSHSKQQNRSYIKGKKNRILKINNDRYTKTINSRYTKTISMKSQNNLSIISKQQFNQNNINLDSSRQNLNQSKLNQSISSINSIKINKNNQKINNQKINNQNLSKNIKLLKQTNNSKDLLTKSNNYIQIVDNNLLDNLNMQKSDINTNNQHINKTQNKNQIQSKQNKKLYKSYKTHSNFIKLNTQPSQNQQILKQQLIDFQNQQNLRNQLYNKRQQQQKLKSIIVNKNRFSQHKNQSNKQLNQFKNFTFNYDFTILKSKNQFYSQKKLKQTNLTNESIIQTKKSPYQQISQLSSIVTKPYLIHKKKKSSLLQTSMPQIISNPSKINSKSNSQKPKLYRQQILLSQQKNKSLIQLVKNHNLLQSKGILIKQIIDGKTQQLKKDSVTIRKDFQQFTRKQFCSQISAKKFISRIQNRRSLKVLDNEQQY